MGQLVQAPAQLADLIRPVLPALPAKIQPGHVPGDAAETEDGPGNGPGVDKGAEQGKGQESQKQPRGHPDQRLHRQVFRLYMDGKSPDEIAEACQLTEDKVREILEGILEG